MALYLNFSSSGHDAGLSSKRDLFFKKSVLVFIAKSCAAQTFCRHDVMIIVFLFKGALPYSASLAQKKKENGSILMGDSSLPVPLLTETLSFLRHHYRARNWTFDENSFLVSSESSI